VISFLAVVAVWEYEQFVKAKGGQMIIPLLFAITIFELLAFYLASFIPFLAALPPLVFFAGFLALFALHFRQRDGAVVDLAVSSFGLLYIAVPMGMGLFIIYSPSWGFSQEGRWWLLYLISVTKFSDIGAYFGGNLWGKRKLAPSISPGKTVEGALFGLLCALGASLLFHFVSQSIHVRFHMSLQESIWMGVILGCTGQFGDLSESLLKRDANKKDSNTLPGFGGVLDAIDSLLFNMPILYFYLTYMR